MSSDSSIESAKEAVRGRFMILKIGGVIAFIAYLIHDLRDVFNAAIGLDLQLANIIGMVGGTVGLVVMAVGNYIEQRRKFRGSVVLLWGVILFAAGLIVNIAIDNPDVLEAIPTEYLRVTKWGFFFVVIVLVFKGASMRMWEKKREQSNSA